MPEFILVLFVLGLGIIRLNQGVTTKQERKKNELIQELNNAKKSSTREAAYQKLCQQYDMSYSKVDVKRALYSKLRHLPFFKQGSIPSLSNIAVKEIGLGTFLYVFDKEYTTIRDDREYSHQETTAVIQVNDFEIPSFILRPERLGENLISFGKDFNFEEAPKFSKNYHLSGENESHIRTIFSKEVLDYFEANARWTLHGQGSFLVMGIRGHLQITSNLNSFIQRAFKIGSMFGVWGIGKTLNSKHQCDEN